MLQQGYSLDLLLPQCKGLDLGNLGFLLHTGMLLLLPRVKVFGVGLVMLCQKYRLDLLLAKYHGFHLGNLVFPYRGVEHGANLRQDPRPLPALSGRRQRRRGRPIGVKGIGPLLATAGLLSNIG
jgi:hypothetical protein